MKLERFLVWLAIGWLLSCAAKAEQFSSPGLGTLTLDVPKQWRVQDEPGPISIYLKIRPEDGNVFSLEVTSTWLQRDKLAGMTLGTVKERVEGMVKYFQPNATETEAQLIELKGTGGAGYHFSLTSRTAPLNAQDKYVTQGMLVTKVGVMTFTLKHRDPGIPERQQALQMLVGATYSREPADSGGPGQSDTVRVVQQEKNYQVWVPTSRVYMVIPRTLYLAPVSDRVGGATNNPRYFHFTDRAFNVSGWFEPEHKFSGMQKFWASETSAWRQSGQPAPVNVAFKTIGDWDAVIYDSPSTIGNNSHIRAHGLQAGTWIDIHLSMTLNRPSAQIRETLETYLKGVFVLNRAD